MVTYRKLTQRGTKNYILKAIDLGEDPPNTPVGPTKFFDKVAFLTIPPQHNQSQLKWKKNVGCKSSKASKRGLKKFLNKNKMQILK